MVKIMYDDFECSVLDEGEQTRWLKITTGVKQGCVMSGFLFLLTVDWTMRRTTERHRNGIRWNFTSTLEDLDFADDIVLISSKYEHIQNKTNRLVDNAGRVGLKLNAHKCKAMRMNTRIEDKVTIGREEVEDVEEFVYLGANVTKEGGGTEDIKKRINLGTTSSFVWSEAWKLTAAGEKKLDRFQFTCLRRILRIWWPQCIRNDTISQVTGIKKISDEIRRRRWNWIGHVLRKERNDDCMVAMGWQPEGKRKVGRPKTTWRRTVNKECGQKGWSSWSEVRGAAQDRASWRETVTALCASWREEN
ncbi:hypothetical protein ACROYT_G010825 [Oculina patagonica]